MLGVCSGGCGAHYSGESFLQLPFLCLLLVWSVFTFSVKCFHVFISISLFYTLYNMFVTLIGIMWIKKKV